MYPMIFFGRGQWLIPGLLLCIASLGCRPSQTSEKMQAPPPRVGVVKAVVQELPQFDEYVGRTQAVETVEVRSRVTGFIKTVEFTEGQIVAKDQLLFKIEPDAYEAIYQQAKSRIDVAKAKVELAQSKLARAKKLIEGSAMSVEEFDEISASLAEAKAQQVSAEADVAIAKLDVDYTNIRSPIAGRIDRALVTPGNIVTGGLGSGTLLTTIVSVAPIHAYFDVDERSFLKYQRMSAANQSTAQQPPSQSQSSEAPNPEGIRALNVPCDVQLADEKDFPHHGFLDFIENKVDSKTGSIRLRAIFENEDKLLKPGQFVRLRVRVGQPQPSVLIPEQCIAFDQDTRYVYVIGDDKVAQRQVIEVGRQIGDQRIITNGLSADDAVVYRGIQRVRDQEPVSPEWVSLSNEMNHQ